MQHRPARTRWAEFALTMALLATALMCLVALWMSVHFEGTSAAIDRAERGRLVAYAAVPGLLVALVGAFRQQGRLRWAAAALVLAAVGLLLSITG